MTYPIPYAPDLIKKTVPALRKAGTAGVNF